MSSKPAMKVIVLHSLPPVDLYGRSPLEFDIEKAAHDIADVLPGSIIVGIRGEVDEVIGLLKTHRPDVIFNACEAPLGRPDLELHFVALLEWVGVPFTGCGSETLTLCRRKDRTKAVLVAAGVPVPRANVLPCVVKPIDEDGSAGIYFDSCMRRRRGAQPRGGAFERSGVGGRVRVRPRVRSRAMGMPRTGAFLLHGDASTNAPLFFFFFCLPGSVTYCFTFSERRRTPIDWVELNHQVIHTLKLLKGTIPANVRVEASLSPAS